jgi:polyketide cyclase/dehydrase/lipid transport protein
MKWVLIALAVVVAAAAAVAIIGAMLPKGHTASGSSRFRQPPQAVWDAITGPPTWRPELARSEELPAHDGHRAWKEIDKHGSAITYEALEETAPTRLVTRIADPTLPYGGRWILEITPEAGGCRLTITEDGEVYNPIFRFMSRFVIGHTATINAYLKALRAKFGEERS